MSGIVYLSYSGGVLGGLELTTLFLTGLGGVAAIMYDGWDDEAMFLLYLDGKLRLKEQVCHPQLEPLDVECATDGPLRTNLTRTTPP